MTLLICPLSDFILYPLFLGKWRGLFFVTFNKFLRPPSLGKRVKVNISGGFEDCMQTHMNGGSLF